MTAEISDRGSTDLTYSVSTSFMRAGIRAETDADAFAPSGSIGGRPRGLFGFLFSSAMQDIVFAMFIQCNNSVRDHGLRWIQ